MQFVAILSRRDGFEPEDFARELPAEVKRATELYADGTFRQLLSRQDGRGAVIVLEAPDLDVAKAAIQSLPMVAKGLLDLELHAVGPYRGFTASLSKS